MLATAGGDAAVATVSRQRGSLPMARDAKLVVAADGRRWGTIGGGCTEAEVTEQALDTARQAQPVVVQHTLNADVAGDVGLSCGGTVELVLEPVVRSDDMARLYGAIADAVEQRIPAMVCTALDWSTGPSKSARVGDTLVQAGVPLPPGGDSVTTREQTAYIDRAQGLLVEPVPRLPRVIIFGAGHVGAEIAKVAAGAGFYVVVTDDRAEFANEQRVPAADEVCVEDFRVFLDRSVLDEDDYVLATTRGHSFDAYIIERTAGTRARYVGMLGSRRKKEVIFRALEEAGVPRDALERVRVPIGEPIGADTPAEIAVSVVAELIRIRRLGDSA